MPVYHVLLGSAGSIEKVVHTRIASCLTTLLGQLDYKVQGESYKECRESQLIAEKDSCMDTGNRLCVDVEKIIQHYWHVVEKKNS